MSKQNIFDEELFFDGYQALRERADCANNLEEKPALFQQLGDVHGKHMLDMGCGFGENCMAFIQAGAASVTGIDLSAKMLAVARHQFAHPNIHYELMAMEDIDTLTASYDIVISSLAIHYIEDYTGLVKAVYRRLQPGGMFLFSQEHPLTSAPIKEPDWRYDSDHHRYYPLSDYMRSGKRSNHWFIDHVEHYHRTFTELINPLIEAGFQIEQLQETMSSEADIKRLPRLSASYDKPNFLLIKSKKVGDRI